MKLVTVVGARPQFIKASVVSMALEGVGEEVLVHTGQHYDRNMSRSQSIIWASGPARTESRPARC